MTGLNNILLQTILLLLCSRIVYCQNLVPNPSFEEFTMCPDNHSQLNRCKYWKDATTYSTCDYFNACDLSEYVGVPINMNGWGFQYPNSGNAYVGLHALTPSFMQEDGYEYLKVELLNALTSEARYYTSFHVNKPNYTNHVVKTIGVFFSEKDSFSMNSNRIIAEPYLENTSAQITDTINWVKIEGSFIAKGGESLLIIGNFRDKPTSDYGMVMNNGGNGAYYYIDDVCVSLNPADCGIDTTTTNVANVAKQKNKFKIFPNPARDFITLTYSSNTNLAYEIINPLGQSITGIQQLNNNGTEQINTAAFSEGVYFLKISQQGSLLETKKIIIQK